MFTGYFFNPKYIVTRKDGTIVARLSKKKSFWGRRFTLDKLEEFEEGEELRVLLGLMMMILLERRRGSRRTLLLCRPLFDYNLLLNYFNER
ncbi:MAG: hypothetical protein R2728_13635 [Chitinophagales bacterium]